MTTMNNQTKRCYCCGKVVLDQFGTGEGFFEIYNSIEEGDVDACYECTFRSGLKISLVPRGVATYLLFKRGEDTYRFVFYLDGNPPDFYKNGGDMYTPKASLLRARLTDRLNHNEVPMPRLSDWENELISEMYDKDYLEAYNLLLIAFA